ncbi:pentapeptide repeat-containing protein [Mastigocoleus sp. MO_188.B34]|uniref:pentapeptide repeat-containing protein n=1 Tax=Mastigocoleus sp. MO_188.B34 TaxID=3036635 RepID=UPI0026299E63|nr:pentapeptide repeat-containing protein [Mastigocoleus sp. MO_188.B34]MDJ0694710.1 pentapeptide repeat-containing protein [Mastigocoleus sp. MO_188.B34]
MAPDYHRAKLRGKSFKGQDLTGVDFSYSDIRGANFTGAILRGANFSHAKAGLQRRWFVILVIFSLFLSLLSGSIAAVGGSLVGFVLTEQNQPNLYVGVVSLIVLVIFFLLAIRKGIVAATGFLAVAVAWVAVAAVAWAGLVAVAWAGLAADTGAMGLAQLVAVIVTGAVGVVVSATGAVIVSGAAALAGAVAGVFAVAMTVAIAGCISGMIAVAASTVGVLAGAVAAAVGISVVVLASYVGCSALAGDEKQKLIRNIIVNIAAKYGTTFQGANLTDADFTQTKLKNTNLTKANLTRTCWFQVKKLRLAAFENTYLEKEDLRELLITKQLQNRNCDGWDLQGINLAGANLKDVSLSGANLSESNLQNADISRGKLVQAHVDKTDFRGANLTGAYIEDWRISPDTKLENVKCEYIFLRVPTTENPNPNRLPSNWEETFSEGDFAKSVSPLSKLSNL